jgi:hypothetical protein
VVAILLATLSLRATEFYTTRYQSLPVVDWLESRPPLVESANIPAASDLVRGLSRALPLLTIRDDAHPRLPAFGPPAFVQRTMGGVRDAYRIQLGSPGPFRSDEVPVRARLDVIVFNRVLRADAWLQLMSVEMDIRDPETGVSQARIGGPDDQDGVWIGGPGGGDGIATVVGHRGAVAFMLQVTYARLSGSEVDPVDLSGRAEVTARQAAQSWSSWLASQIST